MNVYKIQWMALMMPMRVGTFVPEVISLMSKRFSGLGSFLGESCFFECLDSEQALCHTYGCLPGSCFLAVTYPSLGGKFNLLNSWCALLSLYCNYPSKCHTIYLEGIFQIMQVSLPSLWQPIRNETRDGNLNSEFLFPLDSF